MILITGVQTPNVKIINLSQKITPVRNNLKLINLNVNKRKYKSWRTQNRLFTKGFDSNFFRREYKHGSRNIIIEYTHHVQVNTKYGISLYNSVLNICYFLWLKFTYQTTKLHIHLCTLVVVLVLYLVKKRTFCLCFPIVTVKDGM